jgi:hypothetical protein
MTSTAANSSPETGEERGSLFDHDLTFVVRQHLSIIGG